MSLTDKEKASLAAIITHVAYRGKHGEPAMIREGFAEWAKDCGVDEHTTLGLLKQFHNEVTIIEPLFEYEPLPSQELFKLPPGSKFVAFWAKDGDMEDIRLNYDTQTILPESDEDTVRTEEGYEWYRHEIDTYGVNTMQTGRGTAYLYRHPDSKGD